MQREISVTLPLEAVKAVLSIALVTERLHPSTLGCGPSFVATAKEALELVRAEVERIESARASR